MILRKLIDVSRLRRWTSWLGMPFLLGLLMLTASAAPAAAAGATSAQVTVDLSKTLSTVSPLALGVNDAVWDGQLQDAKVPGLLRAGGVKVMRFPGGSTADSYHWQTNKLNDGSSAGTDTFDKFMQVVKKVGATPIITINYGSGTPAEAAAWVKYANQTKHYHIRYWEIGNELYGNGTYGADWETDKHAQGPATYANNSLDYIKAMKAVDPSIQVGLVLTAPGNWPDGQTSSTSPKPWNNTVLPIACSAANFASVHWYPQNPGSESDASLLTSTARGDSFSPSIASMASTLRAEFKQYCGAHAPSMQVMITETNSVAFSPGKQTTSLVNALYIAQDYMNWIANGISSIDWWDVHNSETTGTNDNSSLYGTTNYGDYGLLSTGRANEPSTDTPFPDYYGFKIVSKVATPKAQVVAVTSDQSAVQVFAVKQRNGSVAVLLINTDPTNSYSVSIAGLNFKQLGNVTTYSYGEGDTAVSISQVHGSSDAAHTIAPYSLTALVFHP